MNIQTKVIETLKLIVETIQRDITEGLCGLPGKCMEKIAIERALRKIDPKGGDHKVRIDAGIVKFNLDGHHWTGQSPKVAKRSLIQFDKESRARNKAAKEGEQFESKVKPHKYELIAVKGDKIRPFTKERMQQIYDARQRRKVAGHPDKTTYNLRKRVIGLGNV